MINLKSHLTTTNIYVQKEILLSNIQTIKTLQNENGYNLKPNKYRFLIYQELKKQDKLLKSILIKIQQQEQLNFAFGNPFGDFH